MGNDREVDVKFTGTTGPLKAASTDAAQAVERAAAEITAAAAAMERRTKDAAAATANAVVTMANAISAAAIKSVESVSNLATGITAGAKAIAAAERMAAEGAANMAAGITGAAKASQAAVAGMAAGITAAAQAIQTQAYGSVRTAFNEMKARATDLGQHVIKTQQLVVGAVVGMAGVNAMRSATVEVHDYTLGIDKLGKLLGITSTEASNLTVTLANENIEMRSLTSAARSLSSVMATNPEVFKRLGIDIDGLRARGASLLDILMATVTAMKRYSGGTEQQAAAIQVLKRASQDLPDLMRLTDDALADGAESAKQWGLSVDENAVAAAWRFDNTVDDLRNALLGIKRVVAAEFAPVMTSVRDMLRGMFADGSIQRFASGAVTSMRLVGGVFVDSVGWLRDHATWVAAAAEVWVGFKAAQIGMAAAQAVVAAVGLITAAVRAYQVATMTAATATAILTGGVSLLIGTAAGIAALFAFESILGRIADRANAAASGLNNAAAAKVRFDAKGMMGGTTPDAALAGLYGDMSAGTGTDKAPPKPETGGGDKAAKERAAKLEAITDGAAREILLAENTAAAKDAIQQRTLQVIRSTFGEASKEARDYELTALQGARAAADEREGILLLEMQARQKARIDELGEQQREVDLKRALGEISSSEAIEQLQLLADRRLEITRESLAEELRLRGETDRIKAELALKEQEAAALHQQTLGQLEGDRQKNVAESWTAIFQSGAQAVDRSVQGMIQGTLKLRDAWRNAGRSIVGEVLTMGSRMAATWTANIARMVIVALIGEQTMTSIMQAETIKRVAISAWAALKVIYNNAAAAAAATYKSFVESFGWVGAILGAVAAAGVFAAVAAYGAYTSAEGGFGEVPADGTMSMLHKQEMVLPAVYANPLRSMLLSGGSGGAASSGVGNGVGGGAAPPASAGGGIVVAAIAKPVKVETASPLAVRTDKPIQVSSGTSALQTQGTIDGNVRVSPSGGRMPIADDENKSKPVEVKNPAGRPVFVHAVSMISGTIAEVNSMGEGQGLGGAAGTDSGGGGGSFARGGVVEDDSGYNRLHRREMVLDRDLSEGLQAMIRNGGEGGGGGAPVHHHYYVEATDADSFARLIEKNAVTIRKVSERTHRYKGGR